MKRLAGRIATIAAVAVCLAGMAFAFWLPTALAGASEATVTCHIEPSTPPSVGACTGNQAFMNAAARSGYLLVQACIDEQNAYARAYSVAMVIRIALEATARTAITLDQGWKTKSSDAACDTHPDWVIVSTGGTSTPAETAP